MMDTPHIGFIVAAYAIAALVIVGMIGAILIDYRGLSASLAALEAARAGRRARRFMSEAPAAQRPAPRRRSRWRCCRWWSLSGSPRCCSCASIPATPRAFPRR